MPKSTCLWNVNDPKENAPAVQAATELAQLDFLVIPRFIEEPGEISCGFRLDGFCSRMIQSGLLSEEDRKVLTALARDGSSPCRVTRRANALVLLDEGWNCQQVAHALLFDDDTIRGWRKLFEQRGIEGITSFDVGGSASYLSVKQEDDLKARVGAALPRSTRQIGAWIEKEFGSFIADATLDFFASVTDNFRVINPKDFWVLT
jgi:transposase